MRRNALVEQHMNLEQLYVVKEEMDRAEARKLQPHFIRAFFGEAFASLGGELRAREAGRFEVRHVPAIIRERDRIIGETRTPVLRKYERICFEKQKTRQQSKPMADLIHPNHPLMHATTDLILSAHRQKLKQGTILVDPNDDTLEPRVLFVIDHSVREGSSDDQKRSPQKIVSRRLQFVTIDSSNTASYAGWAPHLDLEPIDDGDRIQVSDVVNAPWITGDLEKLALGHALGKLVPEHFEEVRSRRHHQADKTLAAVRERLTKEINYWADRYIKLREDMQAGKQPRMQPEMARRRHDDISARLQSRMQELEAMKNVISNTPMVIGGALIIPQGLLAMRKGEGNFCADAAARARVEQVAMNAVMQAEQALGHTTQDVSAEKCGWDITARPPVNADGSIKPDRHIEVKGRSKGQSTITVSRNEIIYALNQADKFILAVVIVDGDTFDGPYYIKQPFTQEPDWAECSKNLDLNALLSKAVSPEEIL